MSAMLAACVDLGGLAVTLAFKLAKLALNSSIAIKYIERLTPPLAVIRWFLALHDVRRVTGVMQRQKWAFSARGAT